MRHLHTNSHLRLTIAARQDPDGYVGALLDLAREQIMARQLKLRNAPSPTRYASQNAAVAKRTNLH